MLVMVKKLRCLRCKYRWWPRVKKPARCPHCKSAQWDVPRRKRYASTA